MLTACGGGGGDGGTQLSASQAAYESLVLSPGAVYEAKSNLPSDLQQGSPVRGTHYFYDQSTSLLKSPLTNGPQTLSVGALSTVSSSLDVPTSLYQEWVLFKSTPYKLSAQVREIKYLGGNVVESILTKGNDVISSQTSTRVTATPLSGTVASARNLYNTGIPSTLFSNTALLKSGTTWLPGSAYLDGGWQLTMDKYLVFPVDASTNVPTPIATGTTIQQQMDANTLSYYGDFPAVKYNLSNGSIKLASDVSTGVPTYVANAPFSGTAAYGFYRTFYQLNGNVYAGSVQKSGAVNPLSNYNKQARESIQVALNF